MKGGGVDHIINDESVGKIFEVYIIMRDKRRALFYRVFASTQSAMEKLVKNHLQKIKPEINGKIMVWRIRVVPSIMFLEEIKAGKSDELNRLIKKEENQRLIITGRVFRGQVFCVSKKILKFEMLANDTETAEIWIKDRARKDFSQYGPTQIKIVSVIDYKCILGKKVVRVIKTPDEYCWKVY